jgi:acetylornithine deacetylase/succinyl-diaminopimelate desuccinylase-like protein
LPAAAQDEAEGEAWGKLGREAAELLSTYIRIDSRNPPGRTVETANFLEDLLRASQLEVRRIHPTPDKPILVGRLRGSGKHAKPVVLLNHMDVVPTDDEQWSFPPLSGEIRNGAVMGRGAIDMKGFGIVQLMALRHLVAKGKRPRHDIVFLAVPDEEVGGTMGSAWLAETHPDVMDAVGVWDEGGVGLIGSYPAPIISISVTEKKVLWLRLVAHGTAGHGSRPFPDSAPMRIQQALERIFTNLPPPRLTPTIRKMFRKVGSSIGGLEGFALRRLRNPLVWLFADGLLQQDELTNAMVRDTIALTMLHAGFKPNVIPAQAEATLDCRLLPDTDEDEFLATLRKTIDDPTIHIEILQPTEPAPASPTEGLVYEAIKAAARRVYPDAVVVSSMAVSGTDSRFFRRLGVPAYGLLPFLLTKEQIATVHGVDEQIPVDLLGPAIRVVYEALLAM